jgi:hypothetical protein
VTVRPHWGKEWNFHPEVKAHVMQDEGFRTHVEKFLRDYKQIAELKNFDAKKNLKTFSNAIYRELLNNAIPNPADKIE